MRIVILGSDRTAPNGLAINLGDAMLTDALARAVTARGHDVEVVDFGYSRRGGGEPRRQVSGVRTLFAAIRDADAVILGGGTLLQDDARKVVGGWGGLPRLCAAATVLAKLSRTPVAYFAVGCHPIPRRGAKLLLRVAVRGVPVWVRDADSQQRVFDMLGGRAELGADASLLFTPSPASRSPRDTVVFALNSKDASSLRAEDVAALRAPGRRLVFLNMSQGGDFVDSDSLAPNVKSAFDEVTDGLDWLGALDVISSASAVWASRLQALYGAMISGVPMVAVSALPKVATFARDFCVPSVPSISAGSTVKPALADQAAYSAAAVRVDASLDAMLLKLVRSPEATSDDTPLPLSTT